MGKTGFQGAKGFQGYQGLKGAQGSVNQYSISCNEFIGINPIAYNTNCTDAGFKNAFVTIPSATISILSQYYITGFTASYGSTSSPGNCTFEIYKTNTIGVESVVYSYSHIVSTRTVTVDIYSNPISLLAGYSYGVRKTLGLVGGSGYTVTLNLVHPNCGGLLV